MRIAPEIEAEMRALGMWDAKEGTLEHWLQHEWLPLPTIGAYDKAHAEWVKWGHEDEGPTKLLALLRRADRLLEFDPKILRFGFYETGEGAETPGGFHVVWGRALSRSFEAKSIRRIAWHIEMAHPRRERALEMVLVWTIHSIEEATILKRGTHRSSLPGDWKEMAFASSWGWDTPGRWKLGRYRVTVSYWGETIATDDFTIT